MARHAEVEAKMEKDSEFRPEGRPPAADAGAEAAPQNGFLRGNSKIKWILLGIGALAAAIALAFWFYFSVRESTDDAQIDGYIHPISARVAGYVTRVRVDNNQSVEAGAVLVEIDPKDYQVALERAQAELADAEATAKAARVGVPIASINTESQLDTAEADLSSARAGVAAAKKQSEASEARLREAEANDVRIQADLARYQELIAKDSISRQQYDQAVAAANASAATVEAARAQARAAEQQVAQSIGKLAQAEASVRAARTGPQQVSAIRARAEAAEAAVQRYKAAVDQAELNLKYTTVTAPVGGVVGQRSVQVGQYVQPGQPLLAIVPLEEIWVTANFKETQLKRMRPGQSAAISVDAYGGRKYKGHVDSIAAATGARFSLLPPENATGNYVKVVQRVPVKIVFEKGQDPEHLLRPGMSVTPTVLTK